MISVTVWTRRICFICKFYNEAGMNESQNNKTVEYDKTRNH